MKSFSKRATLFLSLIIQLNLLQFFLPQVSIGQTAKDRPEENPQIIMLRIQEAYDKMESLSFSFTQSVQGQLSGRAKKGHGEAFFIRNTQGGKMRWNYYGDEPQILLSDGQNFYMYFDKLQQMIITPVETMKQDIMYSFFTGTGKLEDNFIPSDADSTTTITQFPENVPCNVIKLTPREAQSQVSSIHLFVSSDSFIRRIEIKDHFDTLTVLSFSNFNINKLNQNDKQSLHDLFSFTPPEGTEIIHQ